jgi:phenylalanyl-tRNA synthetase beta chain
MKIPYGWVREFVDLDLAPADAADRLVNAGVEVASVTPLAPADLSGVVVGEIEVVERELGESHGHRLVLCRVSTGRDRYAVVCGAPNAAVGLRAPSPSPGPLRDFDSVGTARFERGIAGMLCSERELGIGDEHEAGILVVDGTPRQASISSSGLGPTTPSRDRGDAQSP